MDATNEYFRPVGVEGTFKLVLKVFAERWGLFLSISTLAFLTSYFLTVVMILCVAGHAFTRYMETGSFMYILDPFAVVIVILYAIIYYGIMCVADGAIIRAVAGIYVGESSSLHGTVYNGLSNALPLMLQALLIGFIIGGPLLLMYLFLFVVGAKLGVLFLALLPSCVWTVLVVVWTYHVYPIVVIEKGGIESCMRSMELSQGSRWYLFSVLVLFFAAKFFVQLMVSASGSSSDGNHQVPTQSGMAQAFSMIFGILFAMFGSIIQAVVYINMRVNHEGLDANTLIRDLGTLEDETPYSTMEAPGTTTPAAVPAVVQDEEEAQKTLT